MTLQNHPGETRFPVGYAHRYVKWATFRRRQLPAANARHALAVTAVAAAVALVVAVVTGTVEVRFVSEIAFLGRFLLGLLLGLLVASVLVTLHDIGLPRREQRRYLRLTNAAALTERQQQVLALDAVGDFGIAGWNSSLEGAPTWALLPAGLRERYADGVEGAPFLLLPVEDLRAARRSLDERHGIAGGTDAELHVADVLAGRCASHAFLSALGDDDGARRTARLAALTQLAEWELAELAEPRDGRPPQLLWAGDLTALIGVVRVAYSAGYLDAARTWALLDRIGGVAFALFDSYEEYFANLRVWIAFNADSVSAVQDFDDRIRGLRASDWPAASARFPADRTVPLPPAVADPGAHAGSRDE